MEPAPKPAYWTIIVAVLRGEGQAEAARIVLNKIRTEGGLPEAFPEKRNDAIIIAVGKFSSADDPKARAELKRIQEIEISGMRPYALISYLAPPVQADAAGSIPEYNLVRAKELFGDHALYTLQVGVYGRDEIKNPTEKDMAEVRKAAEQAALTLRQEGEVAFYYHGPNRSMVTVGVYDQTDFDPQTPNYNSARLADAKRRHPYNLYNGKGIKEKTTVTLPRPDGKPGGEKKAIEKLQPSNLVAIPKK